MLARIIDAVRPWRRLLFGLYVSWVLVLTLAPLPSSAGGLPDWSDKVVHLGLILGFAVLLYWNVSGRWARGAVVIGVSAAFAGAIELVQVPLTFRSGDVWDFVWSVVGGAIGFGLAVAVFRA